MQTTLAELAHAIIDDVEVNPDMSVAISRETIKTYAFNQFDIVLNDAHIDVIEKCAAKDSEYWGVAHEIIVQSK